MKWSVYNAQTKQVEFDGNFHHARMVEDAERGRYEVKEWMDGKFWVKPFDDLGKAFVEYKACVNYYQRQADYFNQWED